MANLLDTIRQNSQPQPLGQTDQTQQLSTLLRAKSGKQIGGGDVAQSNLGEQQAITQANTELTSKVAPQAAIQNASLEQQQAGQQQQVSQQKQEIAQNRNFDNVQTRIKTNQLIQQLEQGRGKIDMQKQEANMQQATQNLRLQNQQYLDNLSREGQRERLDDANQFQEQMTGSILGSQQELLEKQLGDKDVLAVNNQQFMRAMGNMSTDNAYDMFRQETKQEQQRAIWTGIGSVASAGAGAYGSMGGKSKSDTTTSGADTNMTDLPNSNTSTEGLA